jgi:diketogulonate reductase-like aldo/keto reductase
MKKKKTKNGTEIPVIGLGTYGIGGGSMADPSTDEEHVKVLRKAFELGYTHLDTAEVYASGHSEEVIGMALEEIDRESLFITTKVDPSNLEIKDFKKSLRGSLNRLKTGYIDLYLIHWPSDSLPVEKWFDGMNWAYDEGLIRHAGVSNFNVDQLEAAAEYCNHPIVTNQVPYGLQDRKYVTNGVLEYCQEKGILLTAYSPVKKGSLENTAVKEISDKHGITPAQTALAWLIQQPAVITIPKAADIGHLKENIAAADVVLDDDDTRQLDGISS